MYTLVFEEKLLPYKNAAAGKVYHGKFVLRKVCQSVLLSSPANICKRSGFKTPF